MGRTTHAQSLESIVSGGLYGGHKSTVGGKLLNSLGIESVLYDSNRSEVYFAAEASKLLGEAAQLSTYADVVMESMMNNIRLANDIKKKFGVEALDPVSFSLENEATGASKSNFFKKIWDTIVEVFRRFVLAVANFVKQIQVWISGPIAKAQSDFYTKNKEAIEKGLTGDAGKETITAMKVILKPKEMVNALSKVVKTSGDAADTALKLVEAVVSAKDNKSDFKAKVDKADSEIRYLMDEVSKSASGITKSEKMLPGKEAAMTAVFGKDAKPAKIAISTLFTADDFGDLGKAGFDEVVKFVGEGKKAAASLAKNSGKLKNYAQRVVKLAENKDTVTVAQAATKSANEVKKFQAVQINMIFGGFSAYMRYRGYLYTAAKVLVKGNKKAEKPAKKK